MAQRMSFGLIGYGRFGALAARFLARDAAVHVFDRSARNRPVRGTRVRSATLRVAASQPIVILAVPVSQLENVVASIAPFVRDDAMVFDVCAVKVLPVRWMKSVLPSTVSIIGAHPLFGPDTAGSSLAGHRIVLTPVRATQQRVRRVVSLLRREGLHVSIMTPANHDKMIAETLLVTQFLGRLVGKAKLPVWKNSTKTYDKLRILVEIAERDSEQLLADMWTYNPFAPRVTAGLLRAHLRLQQRVTADNRFR